MSKYRVVTPWYATGQTGEYLREWADHLLHDSDRENWLALARKAREAGLSESEITDFLNDERISMI